MIRLCAADEQHLMDVASQRNVYLEGNILKLIESDNEDFQAYLKKAKELDQTNRKKRLDITKQFQAQNKALEKKAEENALLNGELQEALNASKESANKIMEQNKKLQESHSKNENLMEDLQEALEKAENAKKTALNDLNVLQQKTQFELIGNIVNVALWIIVGVGVSTTIMYGLSIWTGHETTLLGNTWSNMFGILLTNSFSIIGTIMGVKYATNDNGHKEKKDTQ